ncbi:ABC transporter ATP-binding protein [Dongia soli]|uniref:ABC transporter ATP-binding protein n=1 Tax=Dongia soli TaxID=600628 RepID=A0ABU5EEQ3_9PROT|nr:ABC transporter ATP-binding protein [Dongia soli]MDY0884863.1 ABC transporter ATP-binding protein [Dongia soli]
MSAPKLSLREIGKRYQIGSNTEIEAIHRVSFEVMENEICVLLGPSGCGKSTVLRMVAGLEEPSSGAMTLDGRQIEGPGRDRGMVFQAYTSFDWLTVQQNVEYGMRLQHVPAPERARRAQHFLNLVHLSKFAQAYPKQLSGGMKQRVAIARTLANDPEMLLMDEPFGALDAETRWHMQELMISIAEETQTTILMVTHDIEEAIYTADRIVFLSRHPGTVAANIVPAFKLGKRWRRKEEVLELDGYAELERDIMKLMRQQATDEVQAVA